MRGEIISHDGVTGDGLISGDDGLRYEFSSTEIQSGVPAVGQRVDFAASEGKATQIMVLAPAPAPAAETLPAGRAASGSIDWVHLFLKFDGRIRRTHFGIAWLILFAISFVGGFLPDQVSWVLSLVLLWPGLAISVKRLHDIGLTGWIAAIPYGVSIVGTIAMIASIGVTTFTHIESLNQEDPAAVMAAVGPALGIGALILLVVVGFLLWFVFAPSQPGTNRFGPNPKGQ